MKLGSTVGMRDDPDSFSQHVRRLEDAGVEYLWCGEAYTSDAVSALGFVAAVTKWAQIGSSILPLYTRTPSVLAMTAVGLDRLSGGRFNMGIGASGPQVIEGFHGVPYDAPLARTREIIDICRKVWRRERLVHDGQFYQIPLPEDRGTGLGKPLKLINHPVRERIPVFIAAIGPKNVELTAEIAEGWEPIFFVPEKAAEVWGEALAAGQAKRDPALGPLETFVQAPLAIGDDVTHLREAARPLLALYIGGMGARGRNFYNNLACRYGYEDAAREIQELYLAGKKSEAIAAVPDALVDEIALCGPKERIAEQLGAWREAGVITMICATSDPVAVRTMAELLL